MTDYTLYHGSHEASEGKRCAMEWTAYLAGEKHSDSPECVDPFVAQICRKINDVLPHEDRQKLRPYLARTIGTNGDGNRGERQTVYTTLHRPDCDSRLSVCMYCVFEAVLGMNVDTALDFLDRLLPTVPLQLPVAEDAAAVCAVQA